MPKRRIDPTTGEPQLTDRELRFIDEYTNNGGNASQAAAAAGYGAARPGQSAYQVMRRPEVDRRIRERIAQSRVCPDEIIGTLASIMHGSLGDCYDESGKFSIQVAKQNGVDHLIKSISETTRTIEATKTRPAQIVRTYRVEIHSPIQATTALARILGVNPKTLSRASLTTGHRLLATDHCPDGPPAPDHRPLITADFNPLVWLEDLISHQMLQTGQSRQQVIDNLIQTRPEIAKYVVDLEEAQTPGPFDDLSVRDTNKGLNLILDSLIALAQRTPADPDRHGGPPPDSGPETPDSPPTQDSQLETQDSEPTPDFPESMFSSDRVPTPNSGLKAQDSLESTFPSAPVPTRDSGLPPPNSLESMFSSDPVPTPDSRLQTQDSWPTPDSRLKTRDSPPTQDSRLQTRDTPPDSQKYQLVFRCLSESEGEARARLRFSDLIQEWMDRFDLTETAALEAIGKRAALEPWLFTFIISDCMKEYVAMRAAGLIPKPLFTQLHQPPPETIDTVPKPDSGLTTGNYLATPDSEPNLQPATCNFQPIRQQMQFNEEASSP